MRQSLGSRSTALFRRGVLFALSPVFWGLDLLGWQAPRILTIALERAKLRGAPTILKQLSKVGRLKRKVATVRLPSGKIMRFPAYDGYWARTLYAGTSFESDVERIFRRFGKGRVLVDCGANIGYWSARAQEFGFTEAIAIEANPEHIPFLEMNHDGAIHEAAVHSVSGETLLFSGDGAVGHVGGGNLGNVDPNPLAVRSLALRDLGISGPALVKLDVEGAEIAAIEGLGEMDAILAFEDFPDLGMKVTRYLLEHGWKVFTDEMEPVTDPSSVAERKNWCGVNLVALRSPS